ncbi:MAG: putative toxin-antitoxin system toxin component, PIN family [Tannerella sp.]|jgi:putative PIN family toxin of toxin-antitoxin system|nr:putative toxin-antitoxin system toxin component, PIN family [Tannerella sp.]
MNEKYRIIIDTNLWISFLLSKKFDFIDNLLQTEKIQLIFCEELFDELVEVISRPKLRKIFTKDDRELIFGIINKYAVYIPVVSAITVCRDAKDNFLLSLAKDSNANYLLTGDKDLLILKTFDNTQIVTVTEFRNEKR